MLVNYRLGTSLLVELLDDFNASAQHIAMKQLIQLASALERPQGEIF